jgi:protein TonB
MHRKPPRGPLLLSVGLHALVLTALLVSPAFAPEPMFFESFQVTIVSELPPEAPEETPAALPDEEQVVETPAPEPVVEETPPPPPPEEKVPVEEEKPPPTEERDPDPPPPTPPTKPDPVTAAEPTESEGAVDLNVRLEGLRRDYPAYYNSIILEIDKCFRPPVEGPRAVVYFVIRTDGTVSDARLVERSGNAAFDYAALGAVECAGNGRLGPLPDDLPYDRLPVQFTFEPRRSGGGPDVLLQTPFR